MIIDEVTAVAPAGALDRRGGLVLTFNVPSDGALAVTMGGATHDFGAGSHSLKLPSTASAVELSVSATSGTSTLLALNRGMGATISFR